jgi:hypothetical protein
MNHRIRELEKQCWDHQTNHLDTKKFARMILEECQNNLTFHGYDDAADQLEWFKKNRFGVENGKN